MKIEPTMNLDHLTERMWINGDWPADSTVEAQTMRDLLLQGQHAHGWRTTSDVEDAEWFSMLDEAVRRANEIRANAALLAEAQRLLTTLQGMAIHPSHYAGLAGAVRRATGGA